MAKIGRPTVKLPVLQLAGTSAKRKPSVVVETIRRRHAPGSTNTTEMLDGNALTGAGGAASNEVDASTDNVPKPQASAAPPEEDVPLESHEYANIFPVLNDERLAELAQDIHEHGLVDKIDLLDGKILDGRGPYLACRKAGVEPQLESFTGNDPLGYVASRNQHRRDLDSSQRVMVAAKIASFRVGANQHSQGVPIGAASTLMNVSARSTARAKEVLAYGDPALVTAVESGNLTVSAAAELARNRADDTDTTEANQSSPLAPTTESAAPVAAPCPTTRTSVAVVTGTSASPSLAATVPKKALLPKFVLPKPGVTFVVGGLRAAVLEVAVKIAGTISAAGEWPDYSRPERGDVVWLSSQVDAQSFLHPRFEAAGAYLEGVRFVEPFFDNFGLPVRHLSDDLRRLHHAMITKGPAKCIVVDYLIEYLRFGDTGRATSLSRAVDALHEFAVEQGAAIILPCQFPTRDDDSIAEAVTAFKSLLAVGAVFLVKRDTKPNRGVVCPIMDAAILDAAGFPFQLRNVNCVPAVSWDRLNSYRSP